MCRKSIYLISFVLVLSISANASADLVAYWPLDEGAGDKVFDTSGNDNNRTINGATWGVRKYGTALQFNGQNNYVEVPSSDSLELYENVTIAAWINWIDAGDAWICIMANGQRELEIAKAGTLDSPGLPLRIGHRSGSSHYFNGTIDEVRIYNHALTEAEILAAMEGGKGYPYALGPSPNDGALYSGTWATISWRPGDFAVSHDVYMGENFDDVNNGTADTFLGNQNLVYFIVGFPGYPYPDGLVPGTTYYWRIDEVNDANPDSPWKGRIWSFTVPPKKAYNPTPGDGNYFVSTENLILNWSPGFGAKLHTVYFGEDFETVANATGGSSQGVTTYSPGPLKYAKTYYWRVDENGGVVTYTGDVWSFTTEGSVSGPDPADGTKGVKPSVVLRWDAGAIAASHEVYFGEELGRAHV